MDDNFDDVPLASSGLHEGIRQLLEERQLGNDILVIASGHIDRTAETIAMSSPSLIVSGKPGIGKTFHHDVALEGRFIHIQNQCGLDNFFDRMDYGAYELLDPDKHKPEWQKRRDASARAKQALVNKLKAQRNAR